jgi:hypothetical protein
VGIGLRLSRSSESLGHLHFRSLIQICGGDARQAGLLRRLASSLRERIATRASGFKETDNGEDTVASQRQKLSPRGGNQELQGAMPQASVTSRTVQLQESFCIFWIYLLSRVRLIYRAIHLASTTDFDLIRNQACLKGIAFPSQDFAWLCPSVPLKSSAVQLPTYPRAVPSRRRRKPKLDSGLTKPMWAISLPLLRKLLHISTHNLNLQLA